MANGMERVAEILLEEAIKLKNQIKPQKNSENEGIGDDPVTDKSKN